MSLASRSTTPCLDPWLWEVLAWALPKNEALVDLFGALARSGGLIGASRPPLPVTTRTIRAGLERLQQRAARHPDLFPTTVDDWTSTALQTTTNAASGPRTRGHPTSALLDVALALTPHRRNALRRALLQHTVQDAQPHSLFTEPLWTWPTVWTVRLIPIRLWSALRLGTYPNADADTRRRLQAVEARLRGPRTHTPALLALAFNLRTGGFVCDVLHYAKDKDAEAPDGEPDMLEVNTAAMNTAQLAQFLERFAQSLILFGGAIALPRRINRLDNRHLNQWIINWCQPRKIEVLEVLPCRWPAQAVIEFEKTQPGKPPVAFRFQSRDRIALLSPGEERDFIAPQRPFEVQGVKRRGRPRRVPPHGHDDTGSTPSDA